MPFAAMTKGLHRLEFTIGIDQPRPQPHADSLPGSSKQQHILIRRIPRNPGSKPDFLLTRQDLRLRRERKRVPISRLPCMHSQILIIRQFRPRDSSPILPGSRQNGSLS